MPRASRHSLRPSLAELLHQLDLVGALQVGDGAKAALHQPLLRRGADAEDEADRLVGQHLARLVLVEHGKAARLVEVGGDLGQELVAGQADRDGDADVALDVAGKARQHLCRDHAVHALGAGEIEERLVDRQRLDQRRQRLHGVAHLAADADIFRHVGRDHGGVRAERQRLEHRHRRAHAIGARDVAGGRHHAALAAADDHGLVGELGIVALLDGGVERVAVDMRERQRGQRVVADEARGAACAAPPGLDIEVAEAIPAEAARTVKRWRGRAHGTSRSQCGSPSTWRAAAILVGCSCEALANAFTVASSRITKSSTRSQKLRVGGGRAQRLRADARLGQEQAQPFGIAGNEAQRLNCNDFSDFAGVVNRLFQLIGFAFPLTYGV